MYWGTGKKYDAGETFNTPVEIFTADSTPTNLFVSDGSFGQGRFGRGFFGRGEFGITIPAYLTETASTATYTLETI